MALMKSKLFFSVRGYSFAFSLSQKPRSIIAPAEEGQNLDEDISKLNIGAVTRTLLQKNLKMSIPVELPAPNCVQPYDLPRSSQF